MDGATTLERGSDATLAASRNVEAMRAGAQERWGSQENFRKLGPGTT